MRRALMVTQGEERLCEAFNAHVQETLKNLSYTVEGLEYNFMPHWSMQTVERLKRLEDVDVAFFCETAQWMEPLDLFRARKRVVFFHGLGVWSLVWMRRDVELCGNSQWTQDVLRSLGGYPDWASRNMICPDIFQRTTFVKCPLPALENLNGLGVGNSLPDSIGKELERDDCVYGLDSLSMANDQIHASLIVAINMIARQHADGRRFRLIVPEQKLSHVLELMRRLPSEHPLIMALSTLQMTWRDVYLPLPGWAQQSDLFRLMPLSRFFLSFNRIPEPFGMMQLECVLQGCPVYTNGSGNLRFLLPHSGNGMRVEDTEGLLDGDLDEHLRVAALIYGNAIQLDRDGTSPIREDLARGQGFIRENYSRKVFLESFSAMLGRSRPAAPSPHEMQLDLSPTVRQWNRSSGRMLTDAGNHFLEHPQTKELERLLGRSAADLFGHATSHEQAFISELWEEGMLTWRPQLQ
jgi:hypothetical protein